MSSGNFINLDNKSVDFNHAMALIQFANELTVDQLNEVGSRSGFAGDVVKSIKSTSLSISEDEGETNVVVSVDFTDKDGNPNGNAFIFVGEGDQIYLDYPY